MIRFPKYFFAGALIIGVVTSPTIAFDVGFTSFNDEVLINDEAHVGQASPKSELKMIAAQLNNWNQSDLVVREGLEGGEPDDGEQGGEGEMDEENSLHVDGSEIEGLDDSFYKYVMARFIKGMAAKY